MDRAPGPTPHVGPAIHDWNKRVDRLARNLSSTHKDSSVFQFDTYEFFSQVIADPSSNPLTARFKNLTGWCFPYGNKYREVFDPKCGVYNTEYLWGDRLHPTYTMYGAMAAQIAKLLGPGEHRSEG